MSEVLVDVDLREYSERVDAVFAAEIERRATLTSKSGFFDRWRWYDKGSAGMALKWFHEIVEQHPDEVPERIAVLFDFRVREEIARRPKWFTRAHLFGVVRLARDCVRADGVSITEVRHCV
jgi:hypothetical protein